MARQVEDITVKLGIEGFEELNKLRGAFRELTRVTGATDTQLNNTRERLLELKSELGNTTRVNKGLTDAFSALLDEARRGSDVWQKLNKDLSDLRQESRLTDTQIQSLRKIILDEAAAHSQSATSIKEHIKSLQTLREQASLNGNVHRELSNDINKLTDTLNTGTKGNREHYKSLTQILAVAPDKVLNAWNNYKRILDENTASTEKLAVAQKRLNQLSGAPRILERRKITETASIRQDPEYIKRFATFEGKSLEEMPNVTAAWSQKLKELQQDLAFTTRNSVEYLSVAMRIAAVQRELAAVTPGFAQSLVMGLRTGTTASTAQNIREAITALRAEMEQLDTTTAEGSRHYVENASTARQLTQQLNRLGDSYRHVGDMAAQAATAEQNAANARIRNNYLNRGMVRQQEAALAELGQRVRQGVSGTPLLLPAAGQTSAPGTGLQYSGENVRVGRATGNVQQIFAPGSGVGGVRFPGEQERLQPVATPEEADRARRTYIAESDARRANAEAIEQQRTRMENLRAAVDKATRANTGSINSLGNLREALSNLRNEIPATNGEFKQLTNRLQDVDMRSERLSTRASRRLSGMQLAQGVGAALSGGIFGGPAGLVGGLGGLAVGGVGGAFAGAAYGAQIGMFGQQLAATTDYSAQIDKLQIALRGIVGTQDAYSSAMAAATAATQQLNVPQETAIQGMTRLSAAVLGAGGTVNDSAFAFRAVSEAIKATGGNAEQVDGALLALTQVFSKGKVSAEELNQIAERLPGTFTLFAQASGRTGPELQKALQQGQVGLNDLMKFLEILRDRYSNTALAMASSSQEAGARLTVAINEMRDAVGSALQPIGAAFQTAFADFITTITPSVVSALKGIASAFEFLIENETASRLATLALQLGLVTAGFVALKAASAAFAGLNLAAAFMSTAGALRGLSLAAAAAKVQMIALNAITAINPWFALAAGVTAAVVALNNYRSATQKLGAKAATGDPKALAGGYKKLAELQQEISLRERERPAARSAKGADLARLKNEYAELKRNIQAGERAQAATKPPVSGALTNFILPKEADKDKDKAAKKAKSDADSIAAHQQRLAETELDQRLRLEDTIYKHGVELDRKRYELQKNLSDLQAQNRIAKETGVSRDILSNFYQFQQDLRALTERRLDAERAVEDAKRAASSAAARAALSGQMPPSVSGTGAYKPGAFSRRVRDPDAERTGYDIVHPGGLGAPVRTPVALTITGTGFQGRGAGPKGKGYGNWISGEFELGGKKYEMVVGHFGQIDVAPGMKVPAGGSLGTQGITGRAFGAHATTHVNPKAGATTADAWNALDSITTALQQGRTLGATKLPTGVGAQQLRAIKQGGKAGVEQADVAKAEADLALIKQNEAAEAAALAEKFTISITQNLREQNQALTESNQLQALKNRLSYEGFSPERIELELSLEKQRLDLAKAGAAFAQARAYVTGLENISDDEKTRRLAQLSKDQGEYNDHMRTYIQLLNEAYIANQNYNQSVGTGFREGLSKYVESVGTMREATAQLTQTGVKGLEDALFSLVTTGTANFQEFAASILRDTARMILQLTIQKVIMQILGAINPAAGAGAGFDFGGPSGGFNLPGFTMPSYMAAKGGAFGKNGIVPFAYGGIVNKPTLFQFANGGTAATGLLGEAGPEAILPLRRGPSGRLGVETSGAASSMNVTVNVDASGTKAEGDGGRAEQLGRVVSQAVQAELIKQKRPGGLLA